MEPIKDDVDIIEKGGYSPQTPVYIDKIKLIQGKKRLYFTLHGD